MTNHTTVPSHPTISDTSVTDPTVAGPVVVAVRFRPRLRSDPHLPLVLQANAATSLVAGLVGLVAGRWSADRLGLDSATWVRLVGAGLILFALAVAAASRLRGPALCRAATVVSAADLAWVATTVVVVATAGLSKTGGIVAVVMAVGVFDFAALQLYLARQRPT